MLAEKTLHKCLEKALMLATAESCTGGMIAAAITDIAGASKIFDRGFVTYSNEAKTQMLGVPFKLIDQYGAVSEQVAKAMAAGAIEHSRADIAVSTTGIAGPSGGSKKKPVGTVWIGHCIRGQEPTAHRYQFEGDREEVRLQTLHRALEVLDESAT